MMVLSSNGCAKNNNVIFNYLRSKIIIIHHRSFRINHGYMIIILWILCILNISVSSAGTPGNRAPQFLTGSQSEIIIRMKEGPDSPIGTLLYHLRGFDADGDRLFFGVRDQPGIDVIRVENTGNNEANIYLNKVLDREVQDEYSIILTLTDGHLGHDKFVTQSLLLLVDDVNDNEPIFKSYQNTITVKEDSSPGVLTTLEATDVDEGPYGQVSYYLQELDGNDDLFTISTVNGKGIVRLIGKLDYERSILHQLRILAVDRAFNEVQKTGTASILIKVLDVEDQPPEFVMVTPVARISEDAPVGTSVIQVRAIDGDRGINNRITYSILNNVQQVFGIDSYTGVITTLESLDRENPSTNNGAYIIQILAEEESDMAIRNPSAQTEVTVMITDVNDETPSFRSARYVAEIMENSQMNSFVTFIGSSIPEVFDYDQGNNGTFLLYIEGDNGIFDVMPQKAINEASFVIKVKDASRLDYEQIKVINFTLVAQETVSTNPKASAVPVTVFLRDVNDNYPEFTRMVYEVTVPENLATQSTVAWVEAMDRDSSLYGSEGIRYTALSGSVADILYLDPISGIITTKSENPAFDREQISKHYLTVEARDDLGHGNRNTAQLIIHIADVNDHSPTFFIKKYEAHLKENKLEFDSPLVIEAYDLDQNGTENSEIRFSIIDGDHYKENFTIDPVNGILKPKGVIDFEKLGLKTMGKRSISVHTMNLIVEAKDMGIPSFASRVVVSIYIEDVNDNSPYFEYDFYQISIPEDLAHGTSVLQVKAWDDDGSSPNNFVVYRIQSGAEDKFSIDYNSGIIKVANGASLDPDVTDPRTNYYTLKILALDGGIGEYQKYSSVLVNISIIDVNNKSPVLIDPGIVRIKENNQVGTIVCQLKAIDPDDKPVLRYRIDRDNSEGRNEDGTIIKTIEYDFISVFDLNSVEGIIRINRLIDRERIEIIRLALKVEDLAATKGNQITYGTLIIVIEDENDNSPVFRKPYYKKSIAENSPNGVMIVNIVADDPDKNRTIHYHIEGSSIENIQDFVHLDKDTGEMVVAGKIDREQTSWLNISVKATDSGYPVRSSFVDVYIQILDENDNNPYFTDSVTNISVSENSPKGLVVATLEAKDADSGDYGKITYLLDRLSSQGKFSIDPDSGVLTISDQLDREITTSYTLIVEAWDNYQYGYASSESRNAFKQILVTVTDVNDMEPKFVHFPTSGVSITEFHEIGDVIVLLKATDGDDPATPNGRIKFFIEDGNELELFGLVPVDMSSARVISLQSLKGMYGNYSLVVRAEDMGIPAKSSLATLDICITDFNDNAPRFILPPHNITIRIPENTTIGNGIITVEAVDDDKGQNAVVHYRLKQDLSGDWKTFAINENSGLITLKKTLNRKKQKIYKIRVEAYDLGIPTQLSSDLDLTIYVRNINDHQPQFLIDRFIINFTECQTPGIEHFQLVDTVDHDRDEMDGFDDPPTPVCYYIITGNDENDFSLEPLSHKISVAKELDREKRDMYELIIKAHHNCLNGPRIQNKSQKMLFDPQDDSTMQLIIHVNDINDNPPIFLKDVFTGGVTTEANFGMEFMQIRATDADVGRNSEISYYIFSEPRMSFTEGLENIQTPPFIIDVKTGSIFLNFDPQRGMKGYFDFYVMANDTGGLQNTARVLIYLLREDQRVRFVLRQNPPQLREKLDTFRDVLGNVTGAIVNVDECKVHENRDGRIDKTKSDLYIHFVDRNDNSVMEVSHILRLIDENIEKLDILFKEFNVLDTEAVEAVPLLRVSSAPEGVVWMYLFGITIFLSLLLIIVTYLCMVQRARYRRQLKAVSVSRFGSTGSGFTGTTNGSTPHVPNTNIHSVEGSNPMWLQAFQNEWYKSEDSLSQTSERAEQDSLDENVVEDVHSDEQENQTTPIFYTSQIESSMLQNGSIARSGTLQNNLNKNGPAHHQNVYVCNTSNGNCGINNNCADTTTVTKISNNVIVIRKLETTEL